MVVLTERAEKGTLNKFLMDRWEAGQEDSQRWQDGKLGEPIALDRPIELEVCRIFWFGSLTYQQP